MHQNLNRVAILFLLLAGTSIGLADEASLKNPDGTWKWTNRLIHETSPYLQLHAHNPVDWYPWGDEALAQAKAENKLIFLSVGYATCYWCHVMERQVFSNPEIAKQMNEGFINIKIDREERPDLDDIYMTATQLLIGRGGWPNSVFLTPDLKPFYAGTYFPPTDMPGRPGFPTILEAVQDAWTTRESEVIEAGEQLVKAIKNATSGRFMSLSTELPKRELITAAVEQLRDTYNEKYGGFGGAPKFPEPANLELLISEYERTADTSLLEMVTHTLDMMARGGIYEQLGGGFHRYAVDEKWLVPHFEKMLYDNAQLAKIYLQAYALTQEPRYQRIAEEIFTFVAREMTAPIGGFYAALDAETDAEEGKFYVWTAVEIADVLNGKNTKAFAKVYGINKGTNFDGKNVLYVPAGIGETELAAVAPEREALLAARSLRERPLLDTKIIVSWNGLMIDALAKGYEVLGNEEYLHAAQKAAEFILAVLKQPNGQLWHTYTAGVAKYGGYLDDYAFFVRGLLGLYQATGETLWLREAQELTDTMLARFWDDKNGGFYFTQADAEHLIVRTKNPFDSALPSGNAVAVHNLLTLANLFKDSPIIPTYQERVEETFTSFRAAMEQHPASFMHILYALNRYLSGGANGQKIVSATAKMKRVTEHDFEAEVALNIEKGWHLNANLSAHGQGAPTKANLIPTTVSVDADAPVEIVAVTYPKGTSAQFAFSDEPLTIYEGAITFSVQLKRKPNAADTTRFTLNLTYQPCSETECLLPKVLRIPIELP